MLLFSAVPFVIAAFYTLPLNDDFSNSLMWKDIISQKEYWEIAFRQMNTTYMTWQGTYTGNLILYSLGCMYRWGVDGIRIFSVLDILLFLGAMFYLTYMVMKYIFKIKSWFTTGIVYGIFCFCFFGTRIHNEIFYFHTASCMYTVPLAFGAFSIGMALKEILGEKSQGSMVGSVFFGVMACGGALQIPAAVCFIYLLIVIWSFLYRKERFKEALLMFGLVLAGALGNALAPGNFVRASLSYIEGERFQIFRAVKYSVYMTVQEIYFLIKDTYFLFIFWVVFLCFYNKILPYKCNAFNSSVSVLLMVVIGSVITNFPMALGRVSTYMDNRGHSVSDLFLIIGFLFFLHTLINDLKCRMKIILRRKEFLICIICLSASFISYQEHLDFFTTPPFLCIKELKEGKIQQSAEEWIKVLEYLENSEENEIMLPYPHYNQSIILTMSLEDWPEFWVNRDLAEYYQKDAIYYSDNAEPIE